MNWNHFAQCADCGGFIPCDKCAKPVEVLPTLEFVPMIFAGRVLCKRCASKVLAAKNVPHPLTTKHGGNILQAALRNILEF